MNPPCRAVWQGQPEKFFVQAAASDKVNRIRSDGTVEYRKVCHSLPQTWGETTPSPVTVPASCTAGLARGRMVGLDHELPVEVFADKTGKRRVALGCLALE